MKTIRSAVLRASLLTALITVYFYFSYGQERKHHVPILLNAAWNDFVRQVNPAVNSSSGETLGKQINVIRKFLREHEFEVTVGTDDATVLSAIDQARARLRRADQDLQTIRNELSYNEYPTSSEGDPWN